MKLSRERSRPFHFWFSAVLALLATVIAVEAAQAQAYPSRPIKMLVPFGAGSATDVTARLIADKLGEYMGANFVIENRTGAGGNLATDFVAKADPDGYTLCYSASGPLAINRTLFAKLPYDPEADFEPISLTATLPNLLVINPKFVPAKSVQEFIAYVKSKPAGDVVYSSIGNGSSQHLAMIQFEQATGVKLKHVPYRGAPQVVTDLISGEVPITFQNIPSVLGPLGTGQLRALAITTKNRSKVLPDVPTMEEQGLKGFESYAWFGIVAPKGTPTAIVERLNKEVVRALSDPVLSKRMSEIGAEPSPMTPAGFKAFIAADIVKWRKVIEESGVAKVDQ